MFDTEIFAHVIKQLPLGICVLDQDFTILYWNEFFSSRLALASPGEGQNLLTLFPAEARYLRKKLQSVFVLNNSCFSYWEHRPHIFAFESTRPITGEETLMFQNMEIVPLQAVQGAVKTVCLIVQDVTEQASYYQTQQRLAAEIEQQYQAQAVLLQQLQTTQSQLLHADKMASIGQLAAGMAHEINNPLGFINANLQTLQEYGNRLMKARSFDDKLFHKVNNEGMQNLRQDYANRAQLARVAEDMPELLTESLQGLARITKIIENLRKFSHVENVEWQYCNIKRIVESALTLLSNELKYKVRLHIALADELPDLYCQPVQLNQVLLNVIQNAAQAITADGDIWITLSADDKTQYLTIADNGHGIPEQILPRIFEPFFTTKDVGKGSGLGLSMAYNVVKQHQGDIQIASSPQGTTVKIHLPQTLT